MSEQTRKAPLASICEQQVSRYNFYLSAEYLKLRVHFHPDALFRLLRIPISEFTDSWFDAEPLNSREIMELNERFAGSPDYVQMIGIVEEYLNTKIKKVKAEIHSIDNVASTILANPSRFSLNRLKIQPCQIRL